MHWDQGKACIKCGLQKGCSTYCFLSTLGKFKSVFDQRKSFGAIIRVL